MQQPPPNNNFIPQPSFNTSYMQQPMPNPDEINNPTTTMNMALLLMAKAFKVNYSTPTFIKPSQQTDCSARLIVVLEIANQNGKGNVIAVQAEGNGNGNNGNHIRCYNCRGVGHYARNCIVRPRRRDAAFLQTQVLKLTKLPSTIQMDQLSNVISGNPNMELSGGTSYQSPATVEETRAYFESLYNNLVIEVKKVNTVNCKMRETNADLTTELARYNGQEKYNASSPSVARKFLNEIKEFQKILKDEIAPIVNQVDTKEADESLYKNKVLEYENERLLRAVVSQDIMAIVQNNSVVDTLNLQTELDRTKEKLETGVESTNKTRRPQPRSSPKNDRIPSASKSSCLSNNLEKVEEHRRNLLFSKFLNHRSSKGNNIKLAIRNDKYEKNQSANVSESANQKKHKPNVKKSKKLGFEEILASPRLRKPRTCLRWLPTGRIFDLCRKLTASSNTESESDTSLCDNVSASNPQEPTRKEFPNSTYFLDRFTRLQRKNMCLYSVVVL
ncbi:integrase, catalytic region, zinc finger, CCHC-type containing protein [Tanacetum coccineum]